MYDILIPASLDLNTRTEYPRLHDAKAKAQAIAVEHTVEVQVKDRESGTVAHVATYVAGRYFHPFERVETPKFSAPSLDEWVPAYVRVRIETTVYRHVSEKGRWLVVDGRTGGRKELANTTETRHLLTEMKQGRLLEV